MDARNEEDEGMEEEDRGDEDDSASSLPANRFELELEFVQALASPAYWHFLATYREGDGPVLLQDPSFKRFLSYLRKTWTQPQYARFLNYPHCLYFLDLVLEHPAVAKEWALPAYRNFCHQQQFLAWQHRHSDLYGSAGNNNNDNQASDNANEDVPTADDAATTLPALAGDGTG